MGKKQQVISELLKICIANQNFTFHNDLVKQVCAQIGFGNPYDVTKVDNSSLLPNDVKKQDYFIVHLGSGYHKFVKGIHLGYHKFEFIEAKEKREWKYQQSLLDELDTSASNVPSIANNQKIFLDFLYGDITVSPNMYNPRKIKASMKYSIGDTYIQTKNLQVGIGLTLEHQRVVTIIKGKNKFPNDFAVHQLFQPYKYYRKLKKEKNINMEQINCCYVLLKTNEECSVLRLYNYTFDDENQISSIRLTHKAEYSLLVT